MGAIVVWTMGNHDERAPYARALFDSDDDGPRTGCTRWTACGSWPWTPACPATTTATCTDAQLEWLADVLATPARHGTLLAMHHPPLPAADAARRRADRAARAAPRSRPSSRAPTCAASWPATCTSRPGRRSPACRSRWRRRPATPPTRRRSSASSPASTGRRSFTMVHAYDDRLVHTVVPLGAGPEVNGLGLDVRDALESMSAGGGRRAGLVQDVGLQRCEVPCLATPADAPRPDPRQRLRASSTPPTPGSTSPTSAARRRRRPRRRSPTSTSTRSTSPAACVRTRPPRRPPRTAASTSRRSTACEEIAAGDFEMRNDHDAVAGYIGAVATWLEGDLAHRMPGGETGRRVPRARTTPPSARSSRPGHRRRARRQPRRRAAHLGLDPHVAAPRRPARDPAAPQHRAHRARGRPRQRLGDGVVAGPPGRRRLDLDDPTAEDADRRPGPDGTRAADRATSPHVGDVASRPTASRRRCA